ncbi:MAG: ABC transporter permease [Caldilineaceae bacterium]
MRISKEQMEAIRARWGLDEPYYVQYFVWVKNFVTGNLGESLVRQGVPVRDMILEAMPVTATLNIYALLIALGVSIPIGILARHAAQFALDYAASVGSALGIATPNFWLAPMPYRHLLADTGLAAAVRFALGQGLHSAGHRPGHRADGHLHPWSCAAAPPKW